MTARTWLPIVTVVAVLAIATAVLGADSTPPQVDNPVGKWDDYELIIQVDVPLRGTLRRVYVDRVSAAQARRTGQLPYGTTIVMRDYVGVPDGQGGWKAENHRLVTGTPIVVLVQQKQKGWGLGHPESIRNGEWEYALFTPDGERLPVDTEKACMPCHKRYEATDYTVIVGNYFTDQVKK